MADFENPLKEDDVEQDTVVQLMYPSEPPVSMQNFYVVNLPSCLVSLSHPYSQ